MNNATATKTINWDRLAKRSGYNTIKITLEDGTPDGTMQWNYQRGDHTDCWIVTRHDNEDNQVGEGNYMAWNRSELQSILKEMGTQTILELDPFHSSRVLPVFSYTLIIKSDHLGRANKFIGPFETFKDAQEARKELESEDRATSGLTRHHTINIVAVEHPTNKH